MARPSKADHILDALEDELLSAGPETPSLEAVAARADVTKGGVLYHFPTKDAMLEALLRRWATRADEEFEAVASVEGVTAAWLSVATPAPTPQGSRDLQVARSLAALLRAGATSALTDVVHELAERWRARLAAEVKDPVHAEIIRLVGDGIYYANLVGAPPPDPELLDRVRETLLGLAQEDI
ncbi:TetR/AcrR family transcriptional regulator [Microcella alkaliphila]|uniref:TetR family transcriptional regulator n=1 Tax=Microcella alkaliphila TaxID=279828 RepID=A0A0U4WUS8_9MICO|nr:TetR/AcrR family transcriptional regulator [Microcella alkaliphila]BAU31623.1 TetR family transcriptional regulator [Microcella alkaliphila]